MDQPHSATIPKAYPINPENASADFTDLLLLTRPPTLVALPTPSLHAHSPVLDSIAMDPRATDSMERARLGAARARAGRVSIEYDCFSFAPMVPSLITTFPNARG